MTPPTLTTGRLALRAPRLSDFEAYAAFFASERSIYEGGPLDRARAWREFAAPVGQWSIRGYGAWSIELRETGAYCGEVGVFHPADFPEQELGWTLTPEAEGRGIAFEAASAVRTWAYGTLGSSTLVSYIDPRNVRSIRLAERLGARLDPEAAHPDGDPCLVFRHPGPRDAA